MNSLSSPDIEVRLKHDPSQVGITTGNVRETGHLGRMIEVRMSGKGKRFLPESQLETIDENTNFSDDIRNGRFTDPNTLRRLLIHLRLSGRLEDMIYSMEATNTEFHAYQFKPVVKIINNPINGLLIADEVGLGKTIEAGLIWTELGARLDAKNLLVLCPKSLTEKWYYELRDKFNVNPQIMDAKNFKRFLERPIEWRRHNIIICSRDSIRPDKGWDTDEYISNRKDQRDIALILTELANNEPVFDMMVVDESHHLRNPSTQSHKLVELLRDVSTYNVFLSATPIHLKNRDLFAQLKLLDPGAFVNESDFQSLIEANNPIIAAREAILHDANPDSAKDYIKDAIYDSLLRDSESLKNILQELERKSGNLSYEKRAELASRLDTVNLLANLVTRTRRRDVQEFRIKRRVATLKSKMSNPELILYDRLEEIVTRYAIERDINHRFLLATPQRMLTSSMVGAVTHWRKKSDLYMDESVDYDEDINIDDEIGPLINFIKNETRDISLNELIERDTKYSDLKNYLCNQNILDEKLVLFSSFKPTLSYLKERLENDGFCVSMIHGGVKNRHEELDRFKSDSSVDILLSSEIGSEGLDLQFCRTIINYDLPWNPMKVEQRIGRVDRFGQESEHVTVLNFVYDETIDQRIWDRLYDRLQLCEKSLGGFEEILGDEIRYLERDLIHGDLTKEEQDARIEQTAVALENKRKIQDELENEAAGLIAHGDYILNKIQTAHKLNRWLTASDMISYLNAVFEEHYPRSRIIVDRSSLKPVKLTLDAEIRENLKTFIENNNLGGLSLSLLRRAENYVWIGKPPKLDNTAEDIITQRHPLMRFATFLVSSNKKGGDFAQAVCAKIEKSHINPDYEINSGIYLIAVQEWNIDGSSHIEKLAYTGLNLTDNSSLDAETAEILTTAILSAGERNTRAFDQAALDNYASKAEGLFDKLLERFGDFFHQHEISLIDRASFQLRSLERHHDIQNNTIDEVIAKHQTIMNNTNDTSVKKRRSILIKAEEGKRKILNDALEARRINIEQGKKATPIYKDISAIILEVV